VTSHFISIKLLLCTNLLWLVGWVFASFFLLATNQF